MVQARPREPSALREAKKTFIELTDSTYANKHSGLSGQLEIMACECGSRVDEEEEDDNGNPIICGPDSDCINRSTYMECYGEHCGCDPDKCANRRFQKHEHAKIDIFKAGAKGYGVRAGQNIKKGDFIYEYTGEVLDEQRFVKRQQKYDREGVKHFYFMMLQKDEFIDATEKGSLARFCNHSCNPNAAIEKWVVGPKIRMGLFAKRNIAKDEEICFDYKVDRYGSKAQPCYCGESNCSGFLGGRTQTGGALLPPSVIEGLGLDSESALGWHEKSSQSSREKSQCEEQLGSDLESVLRINKAANNQQASKTVNGKENLANQNEKDVRNNQLKPTERQRSQQASSEDRQEDGQLSQEGQQEDRQLGQEGQQEGRQLSSEGQSQQNRQANREDQQEDQQGRQQLNQRQQNQQEDRQEDRQADHQQTNQQAGRQEGHHVDHEEGLQVSQQEGQEDSQESSPEGSPASSQLSPQRNQQQTSQQVGKETRERSQKPVGPSENDDEANQASSKNDSGGRQKKRKIKPADLLGLLDAPSSSLNDSQKQAQQFLIESFPVKKLTPDDLPEFMRILMQTQDGAWLINLMLHRVSMTGDPKIQNAIMNMHGYEILGTVLNRWQHSDDVLVSASEVLQKWPKVTRNKISSSKIEHVVNESKTNHADTSVGRMAANSLDEWAGLAMGYRIPRRKISTEPSKADEKPARNHDDKDPLPEDESVGSDSAKKRSKEEQTNSTGVTRNDARLKDERPPKRLRLPPGWEAHTSSDGRTYYVSEESQQTQWTPPPDPRDLEREAKIRRKEQEEERARLEASQKQREREQEEIQRIINEATFAEKEEKATQSERSENMDTPSPTKRKHRFHSSKGTPTNSPAGRSPKDDSTALQKILAAYIPKLVIHRENESGRERCKRHAREIVHILVGKEMAKQKEASNYELTADRKNKIKSFVKVYMDKVCARHDKSASK